MREQVIREQLRVYGEGESVWREEFPVIVAEDGEHLLSHETALKLEERQKYYLKLAERGELPEPSESGKGSHEAAGG